MNCREIGAEYARTHLCALRFAYGNICNNPYCENAGKTCEADNQRKCKSLVKKIPKGRQEQEKILVDYILKVGIKYRWQWEDKGIMHYGFELLNGERKGWSNLSDESLERLGGKKDE